jgi:hypothetical protein
VLANVRGVRIDRECPLEFRSRCGQLSLQREDLAKQVVRRRIVRSQRHGAPRWLGGGINVSSIEQSVRKVLLNSAVLRIDLSRPSERRDRVGYLPGRHQSDP